MVLHLRDDKDKLYVSRNEGRRGLVSFKDGMDKLMQGLGETTCKRAKKD